ncbi:MAG TPA: nucleotide exchange factor GrpE [Candidatus Paceibacterota bacterium]|nr:nucleotide exchange factor GrpE [Candidatus Paceibacterota bacterium]
MTAERNKKDQVEPEEEEIVETNEDGEELPGKDQLKRLRERLKEAVAEKQKYLDNWQRDKAEFINARKRDEERNAEHLQYASARLVEELLPVLDSFDAAISKMKQDENVPKEWRSGLESIDQQLRTVLSKNAVEAFGEVGDSFDPNFHQSIASVKSEGVEKSHTVAEVVQKGYKMKERLLRPALVKVYE